MIILLLLIIIFVTLLLADKYLFLGTTRYSIIFYENVLVPAIGLLVILLLLYSLTNLFEPSKNKMFNIRENPVQSTAPPKEGTDRWYKERDKLKKELKNKDFSTMTPQERKNTAKKMYYYMTPEQKKKYRERIKK